MTGEAQLQSECVRWFRLQYPKYAALLFAIPNGGSRNILEAYNLKRQGVVSGVPDLMLAVPNGRCHGLFIEMKYGKGRHTKKQKEMIEMLTGQGYEVRTCWTFEDFRMFMQLYLM